MGSTDGIRPAQKQLFNLLSLVRPYGPSTPDFKARYKARINYTVQAHPTLIPCCLLVCCHTIIVPLESLFILFDQPSQPMYSWSTSLLPIPASICLHWITVWGGVSLPSNRTSLVDYQTLVRPSVGPHHCGTSS